MTALAKALSQAIGTEVEAEALKSVIMFCTLG
jgi:hypothetical protein